MTVGKACVYSDTANLPGGGLNRGVHLHYPNMPTFPGFQNESHDFIIAFWIKWDTLKGDMLYRHDGTQPGGYTMRGLVSGPDYVFQTYMIKSNGGSIFCTSTVSANTGTWYHCAMFSSSVANRIGMVIYNKTNGTEYIITPNVTGHCGGNYGIDTSRTTYFDQSRAGMKSWWDDLIVHQGPLADRDTIYEKIREMRSRGL
jgi:hypothetical protein